MSTNQRKSQPVVTPAFVITEKNELDYVCVLPVDPVSGYVVVDTNYCTINKGDRNTIATKLYNLFRSAGVPVVKRS
jgi:hypothetical protein